MFGKLVPKKGGDPIPLLKKRLRVGKRDECDIVLKFSNVSATHCLMEVFEGYWFLRDLDSTNGTRINGKKLGKSRKRINPDDVIAFATREYTLQYEPTELGAYGTPPPDEDSSS